jgi:hypothetical protein
MFGCPIHTFTFSACSAVQGGPEQKHHDKYDPLNANGTLQLNLGTLYTTTSSFSSCYSAAQSLMLAIYGIRTSVFVII